MSQPRIRMRKVSNKNYHKLLSHSRWRELRQRYLASHPLCEECERAGKTTIATCVHHIRPVESQGTPALMMQAAYDWHNLEALCEACHEARHKMCNRSKSKEQTRLAAKQTAEAFMARWCRPQEVEAVLEQGEAERGE